MSIVKNCEAHAVNGVAGNELMVSGFCNTGPHIVLPDLRKHIPQGIDHSILLLDLIGATDAEPETFQPVQYNEKIGRLDQYAEVAIYYQEKQVAHLKVVPAPVNIEA